MSHQSGNTSHTGVGKWIFRCVMIFTSRCEDDASLHLMGFSIRLKNMLLMWVVAPGMDIKGWKENQGLDKLLMTIVRVSSILPKDCPSTCHFLTFTQLAPLCAKSFAQDV